jgi:hypothetical protein
MKKVFYFAAGLVLFSACNFAGEEDYKNVAKDLCDCAAKSSSAISPGMNKAIVDMSKTGGDIEAVMKTRAEADPMMAIKDAEGLMSYATTLQKCTKDLEGKYKNLQTLDQDKDVQDKMLKAFEEQKGCELTAAMMKLGLKESAKKK